MARVRRLQLPGFFRHVMSRGNGRMEIFLDEMDYRRFVHILTDIVEKFEIDCWNYCVMPNHYHATLRPTRANLSKAVKELNGIYAQWWNWRHQRVGHVFQGRFKDQIVEREGYLLALCRYVALNPVRAGLVDRPEDWAWSSYAATVGLKPLPPFIAAPALLRQFGEDDPSTLQSRFAAYVLDPTDTACSDDRFRSKERVLGNKAFKAMLRPSIEDGEPEPLESTCHDVSGQEFDRTAGVSAEFAHAVSAL